MEALSVLPNPNPVFLLIKLAGPADEVEIKVYSPALNAIKRMTTAPLPGGWSRVALPADLLGDLPNGLFHLKAVGKKDGAAEKGMACKAYLAR